MKLIIGVLIAVAYAVLSGLAFRVSGGGWAEGYYIHYWLYEWLFFCEVARHCEGKDYYATAPGFFRERAVASMFEMYPGIRIYNSRRPIPMGDGGMTAVDQWIDLSIR